MSTLIQTPMTTEIATDTLKDGLTVSIVLAFIAVVLFTVYGFTEFRTSTNAKAIEPTPTDVPVEVPVAPPTEPATAPPVQN